MIRPTREMLETVLATVEKRHRQWGKSIAEGKVRDPEYCKFLDAEIYALQPALQRYEEL
jgi:hypothetical protein